MKFYCNPIKKGGDFADPFVIKYNGKYYLYCTNHDIRCWSSYDLVDWEFEGPVIYEDTFPALVPFAPEVVYWNGSFYMYTSPHGRGHFVLKSKSPTGPFEVITENVGHSIDGSVFIDDDGKWYFYWADDSGILGCEMKSPTEFGEPVNTGVFMYGWTEGPQVIKEDGLYYITYTGNHYLSKGYRINAAVSKHPLKGYVDCDENPIIINTENNFVGLGHNSTVYGPDMLTRYIIYHNINPDSSRDLDIDALLLGKTVQVMGPTNYPQPVPKSPNFSDCMNSEGSDDNWIVFDGNWAIEGNLRKTSDLFACISKSILLEDEGVIEFNFSAIKNKGKYGVTAERYKFEMNVISNSIKVFKDEFETVGEFEFPYEYKHNVLHCLQLRYNINGISLIIDGVKIADCPINLKKGDKIGYFSDGAGIFTGYTAFSSGMTEKAYNELYSPIPCTIKPYKETIKLNVPEKGTYILSILCDKDKSSENTLIAEINGTEANVTFLSASHNCLVCSIGLPKGFCEITMKTDEYLVNPKSIEIFKADSAEDIQITIDKLGPYDKKCFGDCFVPAFEIVAEYTAFPKSGEASVGILLRASKLADGGEGNDKKLGTNFFIGYCVSQKNNKVVLAKHRYDQKELASVDVDAELSGRHMLQVQVNVNNITIYLDNGEFPILEYCDDNPIMYGESGIRVKECEIENVIYGKNI